MLTFIAEESEQCVLGSILIEPSIITEVASTLKAEDFGLEKHRIIYQALVEMHLTHTAIDALTLLAHLGSKSLEVGGIGYILELTQVTPTAVTYAEHVKIVREKSTRRQAASLLQKLNLRLASDEPLDDFVSELSKAALDLTQSNDDAPGFLGEVMLNGLEVMYQNRNEIAYGLSTGLPRLDRILGGLHGSDLIILAARPAVGKSALAMQIADAVAKDEKVALVFSLEMSTEQLGYRLLANEANVDASKIRNRLLSESEWDKLFIAASQTAGKQIYVDDSVRITPVEMLTKARRLKLRTGLDLIVVDYLQLMTAGKRHENRQQEVSEISRMMKLIAKELNVPVLALSQLSRAVEHREDKIPRLSDLREAGSLEQDADVVVFLHRPDDPRDEVSPVPTNALVRKNRHGPTGTCALMFMQKRVRFEVAARQDE